uniref:Uncharacterized protein n=1 Tax=Parascaris univalens TaxID=6257 RepID=A0A914ZYX1_PARUN
MCSERWNSSARMQLTVRRERHLHTTALCKTFFMESRTLVSAVLPHVRAKSLSLYERNGIYDHGICRVVFQTVNASFQERRSSARRRMFKLSTSNGGAFRPYAVTFPQQVRALVIEKMAYGTYSMSDTEALCALTEVNVISIFLLTWRS